MRKRDVAELAGVSMEEVQIVSAEHVRAALVGLADANVLEVATQEGFFWRVGEEYFLDDPYFGDVVNFRDLRMSEDLGLYDARHFGENR